MSGNLRAVSEGRLRGGFVKELCAKNRSKIFFTMAKCEHANRWLRFFEGMGPDMKENSDRS